VRGRFDSQKEGNFNSIAGEKKPKKDSRGLGDKFLLGGGGRKKSKSQTLLEKMNSKALAGEGKRNYHREKKRNGSQQLQEGTPSWNLVCTELIGGEKKSSIRSRPGLKNFDQGRGKRGVGWGM